MSGSQRQQPPNHFASHPPSLYMCTAIFHRSCFLLPHASLSLSTGPPCHVDCLPVHQQQLRAVHSDHVLLLCFAHTTQMASPAQPPPPSPSFLHSRREVEEVPRDTPPHTHAHTHTYSRHQQTRHHSTLALDSRVWRRPSAMRMPSRHGLCRR